MIPLFLTGAWLLRLSQSKSALVCLATAVFFIMKGRRFSSRFLNRFILIFALSLPALILFSSQFSDITTPLLHAIGRDATFTGRTEIWKNVTWDTVNPLVGAGYWNFWGGPGGTAFNESLHEVIPNAHNGYIDMYLDGGMIGIALLYLLLIVCGWKISKRLNVSTDTLRYQRARFAFLIVAIIYNNSESTFGRLGPMWFTTLLMLFDFPALKVTKKTRNADQPARPRDLEAILVKQ